MKCPHEPCAEKKLIGGCAIQYNISILLFVWCFAHMKEKVGTKQLTLLHQSTEEETKKKKKKKWYLSSLFFFSPSGSCSSSRSSEVYIYIYTPKAELLLRQVAFSFFFFFFFFGGGGGGNVFDDSPVYIEWRDCKYNSIHTYMMLILGVGSCTRIMCIQCENCL